MNPQPRVQPEAAPKRGRLVYVIGPSGAGKDSILHYARRELAGEDKVWAFPRRTITRAGRDGSENHVAMTPSAFERARRLGRFALDWTGNGLSYGIGIEIDDWLGAGRHVIVNGSRAYLPEATRRYPDLIAILIAIDPLILRHRLLARGRERPDEIEGRLQRASELQAVEHPGLQVIRNDGPLEEAGLAFLRLLRALQS